MAVVLALTIGLSACGGGSSNPTGPSGGGGGGGGGGGAGGGGGNGSGWSAGVYLPSTNFAAHCAVPRPGTSDRAGSVTDENNWLRSWTNELYLWYSEVPDLDPSRYSSTASYFNLLKTSASAPSGRPKDRFHFTYNTADWIKLSQGGQSVGYGVDWSIVSATPPRRAVIAFVQPLPPPATAAAGLSRGQEILSIDGVDLVNDNTQSGVETLNAGLSPARSGETHTFGIRERDGTTRRVTLTAATVTENPVPLATVVTSPNGARVGYILFNDHTAPAEPALRDAINFLKGQAVPIVDLVLDLRYNGGGYLDIAAELAYMIAGPARTAGQAFERTQFNDKYPTTDPFSGSPIVPTPFWSSSVGLTGGLPPNTPLPTLDLPRVYVITGNGTCSASEAIMNGLRGVDVQVFQFGATTCGKPYGFFPEDNCGTTYFSIQFRGVNNKGFGDYADGFEPATLLPAVETQLLGCRVADDFTRQLGDVGEDRLESALGYRDTGTCPAPGIVAPLLREPGQYSSAGIIVPKPPWRMNRILRR